MKSHWRHVRVKFELRLQLQERLSGHGSVPSLRLLVAVAECKDTRAPHFWCTQKNPWKSELIENPPWGFSMKSQLEDCHIPCFLCKCCIYLECSRGGTGQSHSGAILGADSILFWSNCVAVLCSHACAALSAPLLQPALDYKRWLLTRLCGSRSPNPRWLVLLTRPLQH